MQIQKNEEILLREKSHRKKVSGTCLSVFSVMGPLSSMEPIEEELGYKVMDCNSSQWSNRSVREFS